MLLRARDILRYEVQGEELTHLPADQIALWPLRFMIPSAEGCPGVQPGDGETPSSGGRRLNWDGFSTEVR